MYPKHFGFPSVASRTLLYDDSLNASYVFLSSLGAFRPASMRPVETSFYFRLYKTPNTLACLHFLVHVPSRPVPSTSNIFAFAFRVCVCVCVCAGPLRVRPRRCASGESSVYVIYCLLQVLQLSRAPSTSECGSPRSGGTASGARTSNSVDKERCAGALFRCVSPASYDLLGSISVPFRDAVR